MNKPHLTVAGGIWFVYDSRLRCRKRYVPVTSDPSRYEAFRRYFNFRKSNPLDLGA